MARHREIPLDRLALRYVEDPATGCWNWSGATSQGYGIVGTNRDGTFKAHRVSYERAKGRIPDGFDLDHLCRNRRCINPEHLEPVTNAVNARRGAKSKLTWDVVRSIRAEYAAGGTTFRKLAAKHGTTGCNVSNIINGKRWKEVDHA